MAAAKVARHPEGTENLADEDAEPTEDVRVRGGITRRNFVKWGALAGAAAGVLGMGALSTLGFVKRAPEPPPPWEIAPGVVDYETYGSSIEGKLAGPTPNILRVAQWYDYWPGSFLDNFVSYMRQTYGLTVDVRVDIYTSNEELFEMITLGGKKYDVMFPTNHLVDNIKKGGFIYNLNTDWLPNTVNLSPDFHRVPHGVDSPDNLDQRQDPNGLHFVSIPYFYGTTGLAFRKDKLPKEDVEEIGWDFFRMSEYTPSNGWPKVTLQNKMRMLQDQRDVYAAGFKEAGWLDQEARGLEPTPYDNPYTDTTGKAWPGGQWTSNEVDPEKVNAMGKWLFQARPNIFDFNSTGDTPTLIAGVAVINQAWSGDITYAQRPDQSNPQPADFIIPKQGTRWWGDTAVIHSECRNLWLAHQFINFIHSVADPWPMNQLLTRWNLYPTTNKACYDYFYDLEHDAAGNPTPIYASGWVMTDDVRLYPNILDPDGWARCDIPRDVGLDALVNLYNPLWFDLTAE